MTIHFLNTFSCNARFQKKWKTGLLSLLIETEPGLVLVDAGLSKYIPAWAIRLALGSHKPHLQTHPKIQVTSSHMFLDFFEQ